MPSKPPPPTMSMNKSLTPAMQPVLWPQTFAELEKCAERWARTDFVPLMYRGKPDAIIACVQMGSELGLSPFAALRSIAVINGMPSLYGDAMLAICKASPVFGDIMEKIEGEGKDRTATCMVERKGHSPVMVAFSMADAEKAKLASKEGPWQTYPDRMLKFRARGFALRDQFPDVLRGFISREEAEDYPPEEQKKKPPTIDGQAEPWTPFTEPPATKPPQTAATPPVQTAPPTNGGGMPSDKYQAWLDHTFANVDTAASDAEAVTLLRAAIKPDWTALALSKIASSPAWEERCQLTRYGPALRSYLTELVAERDRAANQNGTGQQPEAAP